MAKRRLEQTPVSLLTPPCKRCARELPTSMSGDPTHSAPLRPRRKRKPEPVDTARVPAASPCDRGAQEDAPGQPSPPPRKRQKVAEIPEQAAFKCQVRVTTLQPSDPEHHGSPAPLHPALPRQHHEAEDDEICCEFNSFQFWKAPLPDVDFSEIERETCEDSMNGEQIRSTETAEDMDS